MPNQLQILFVALAIAYSPCGYLIAQIQNQVDRDETIRRGDMVTRAGSGPRDAGIGAIADAMAPPADDSNRFFVTVIVDGSEQSKQLEADLEKNEYLRAFIRPEDQRTSWAHYNRYIFNDQTQAWRWKSIKLAGYPTIIVQPPRNKRFGDPATVVCQLTGYQDAKKTADKLRESIAAYARKQAETPPPAPGPKQQEAEGRGYDAPFAMPAAPPAAPTPAIPSFEIPPTPQQPQQVNAIALLVTALSALLGGSLTNLLLLGILAMQGWRYWRTKSGLPTILNDEQYARLIEVLSTMSGGQKPNAPQ